MRLLRNALFAVPPLFLAVLSIAAPPAPKKVGLPAAVKSRQTTNAAPAVLFARDVEPVFRASCYPCHSKEEQSAGLRLDGRAFAMKGGLGGASIVPGNSKKSLLLQRIKGHGGKPRMPLGFAPLTDAQTAKIARWIDEGAHWSGKEAAPKHWAYVPPVRPAAPKVRNTAWVRNPIDAFVLERLEREGLKPSPAADRATLIRRVSLDLTGLPPTPAQVDAFVTDRSPNAYENVVDGLLASPHYGERWARPWLDLARFADTHGYEKDGDRSLWLWRDWVIDALNRDMPFDKFTIEQIAGDLLPNATESQRIATGFHRNTMHNEEGGVDREEQRWLTLVDRVGTTGAVWLGSTIACAQCHDHKYDPVSQKDFYRLLAFFDHTDEPTLELLTPQQRARRAELEKELAMPNLAKERQDTLKKELASVKGPTTLVFAEKNDKETPATFLRIKGAFLSKGDKVTAGTPTVLNSFPKDAPVNRLGLARWLVSRENPLTARVAVNRAWESFFGVGLVETSEDFGTQGAKPTHPPLLDWLSTEFVRRGWSQKALHRLIVTSNTYRQSSRVSKSLLARDPQNRLLARGPRFRMEAEMLRDNALAAAGLLSRKQGGAPVFPDQPEGIWNIPYNGAKWVRSAGEDRWRRGIYTFWRRTAPYPMFLNFDATSREACTVRRIRTNTPLQALTTLNDTVFVEASRGLARRMQKEGGATPQERIAYGFRLCVARRPKPAEAARLVALHEKLRARYTGDAGAAQALNAGDASTSGSNAAESAAYIVVANVLLNLDEALTKE